MSASKQQSKGSKNQGVVIVLFIALFIIGGGAAYLIIKGSSSRNTGEETEMTVGEEEVEEIVETKSLVETAPPLPEETPTLSVIEDPVKQTVNKNTTKKWLPASGTIDPKVARSFIKSNSNKVRACYERELKVNNLLQGKVTTSILINQDGTVANVKFISDSVGSQPMRQCIKQEIVSWRFPKPEGGRAEVQFPFKFEPKQ